MRLDVKLSMCIFVRQTLRLRLHMLSSVKHSKTPVSIREDLTLADLEALKTSLVNEIMSSLSAQLGIEHVSDEEVIE